MDTSNAKPISAKEALDIISKCARLGVKNIKMDWLGLEVEFSGTLPEKKVRNSKLLSGQEASLKDFSQSELIRRREMELSQMDLEDPLSYEQLILSNSEKEFVHAQTEDIRSQ